MDSDVLHSASLYNSLAWLEKNKKQVIWGVSAALIVGFAIWTILWQRAQKQEAANEALSQALMAHMSSPNRTEDPQAYLNVARKNPGSEAAVRAQLMAAGALFSQGKHSEAQAQFEQFTREHRESPFLPQAQLGIAACLEATGKTDAAIEAYRTLVERYPTDPAVPQARFALARLYELQGKPERALPLYEEVGRSQSSIGSEAGMRAEELKLKHPELARKTTSSPTPPLSSTTNTLPLPVGK